MYDYNPYRQAYNPYPQIQANYPQTFPQRYPQQQMQIPVNNIVKGRVVTGIEEARAAQVDLDGTPSYFPSLGEGKIYVPLFLIECISNIAGYFIIKYAVGKGLRKVLSLGDVGMCYLIWYGLGRLFIEAMRTDNLMIGSFRIAQIVSLLMIFIGIIIYFKSSKGSRFVNQYHDIENFNESK